MEVFEPGPRASSARVLATDGIVNYEVHHCPMKIQVGDEIEVFDNSIRGKLKDERLIDENLLIFNPLFKEYKSNDARELHKTKFVKQREQFLRQYELVDKLKKE